jgi:transcriptional regulator with XRE-family HTH domain
MSSTLFVHVSNRLRDAGLAWTDSDGASSVPFVPEDDYLRRLGAVIRAARKARGWGQEELADRVGRDKNSISRWERGATSLSAYNLVQLWEALEIPADWLIEPTDSLSELDRRVAQLRRAAEEAARADVEAEQARASAAGRGTRSGKR